MKNNENISKMHSRLQDETVSKFDTVIRNLNFLTNDWERKALDIEKANDLSRLKIEKLNGNLMAYEVHLQVRKLQNQEKMNIAFQVEDSELDEDE